MWFSIFALLLFGPSLILCVDRGFLMGCYKDISAPRSNAVESNRTPKECVDLCHSKYYRYSFVAILGNCACHNYLGDQKDPGNCTEFCKNCNIKNEIADVYFTGISDNGPPQNLTIGNITDTQAHLIWTEPESFVDIVHYKVVAHVLFTYSSTKLVNLAWTYSNNTNRVELISLHPGTRYNITVQAVSSNGEGAPAFKDFDTVVGVPDHIPSQPEIIEYSHQQMKIKLKPTRTNNNGPITSYLIVVINSDSAQAVQTENLKPYRQAVIEGYTYYIAAEIQAERVNEIFTVGDGKSYGKYYNSPLEKDGTYHIMLGVVSRTHNAEKVAYSQATGRHNDVLVLQMSDDLNSDSPALIIGLSVAIGLISCLLIIGIIGFYILRNHVHHRHRQRLNDNQELTLQGPMIDIENNGYIHEEDAPAAGHHYENLNEQVWIIPRNLLNIEHTILLGIGTFGRVHSGSVLKDKVLIPAGVYSIADRKLNPEDKRSMLKDLDVLIKSKKHPNVLDLIGTCESMDTICVVFEQATTNLKDLLLSSRVFTSNKFSNLNETQAIDFAMDISRGMDYLHTKKILHKQLCSLHIAIVNGHSAKISGFGLAKYYKSDVTPDFTRFTAKEIFRKQQHVTKSDIWSFACVLWEIATLGGTPYGNISNNDLPEKIVKGLRLAQLPYINDSLYQIMLNCWQLDLDERPSFAEVMESLDQIKYEQFTPSLNFTLYQGFQYEPYLPEMEAAKVSTY